jgi:hypothetical protein
MAKNHFIVPTLPLGTVTVARLGAGNAVGDRYSDVDVGKFVKLAGESRYDLTAVGNPIEGVVVAVETATSNGYSVGSVLTDDDSRIFATADGLQATPGTGVIAVGDYVVTGTVVAKGTAMSGYPKVCKATSQTFGAFAWRVVSLGQVGTGAAGTTIVIERV